MTSSNKPANLDGWNDPPANLALTDNISTKRVILNKRVPYTNQDLSSTNAPSNTLTAPPVSSAAAAASSSTPSETESSKDNDLLTIEGIDELFQKQIKKLEDSSNVEKKVLEDINKKFQLMSDDWSQNKLSVNTKQILGNIFRELDSNHVQEAFDMHITLVRNASSEVARFIVGVKRLIQELQRIPS